MEMILNEDYCKIVYEKDINLMTLTWLKHPSPEEYKYAFTKRVEAIKKYKIPKLITDTRKEGVVSPSSKKWLETVAIPEAVQGGLKYVASVLDHDAFKKYYLTKIKSTSEQVGMEFKIFDNNLEEALNWILSKPN